MPKMKVIPPGLDFSSLKVDLPEDPVIKEMEQTKPAFNARTYSPRASQDEPSGTPKTPKTPSKGTPRGHAPINPQQSLQNFHQKTCPFHPGWCS